MTYFSSFRFTWVVMMAFCCAFFPCVATAAAPAEWDAYKARFIQQDGRVIDVYNNQMSHSEGQSFSMYLALSFDDKSQFDTLWRWTRDNLLVVEGERLPAWSWGRREDGTWGVLDPNNATDADLMLAWTLMKAASRWNEPAYKEAGAAIASAIRGKAVATVDGKTLPLPGRVGFVKENGVVLNPSYFIFPAMRALAGSGDAAFWTALRNDSLSFLARCQAGPLNLPPDWVFASGGSCSPWSERPADFSYDAIRVPLYLAWDGDTKALEAFRPLLARFARDGALPARIALAPGGQDKGDASGGFYAVLATAARTLGDQAASDALWAKAQSRLVDEKDDYYSHVLFLMAKTRGL